MFQSIIDVETGKDYLVRAIVNDTLDPVKILTVCEISEIGKYWRQP